MFTVVQSTTELQYVPSSPFPPTSSLSLVAPCLMGLIVTVQRVQVIEAVHLAWQSIIDYGRYLYVILWGQFTFVSRFTAHSLS
jgi:hypothetical protein